MPNPILANQELQATIMPNHQFLETYGRTASETLKNHPEILKYIKKPRPDFQLLDISNPPASKVVQLSDGREVLIMRGCTTLDCKGGIRVVSYIPETSQAYALRENLDSTIITVSGKPDKEIRDLLIYFYYHE